MPIMAILIIASVIAMLTSTIGAVTLGKGPSVMWSVVMFGGMALAYVSIGTLVFLLYTTTGTFYVLLAAVPVGMTVAALRAYRQSKEASSSSTERTGSG